MKRHSTTAIASVTKDGAVLIISECRDSVEKYEDVDLLPFTTGCVDSSAKILQFYMLRSHQLMG